MEQNQQQPQQVENKVKMENLRLKKYIYELERKIKELEKFIGGK